MLNKRWRFFGVFVFAFFAFMELGDLLGMLSSGQLGQAGSSLLADSPGNGWIRSITLLILAFGILISSLATAYALVKGAGWARYGAMITSVLFYIYGGFHILGGFLSNGSSQAALIFTGIMYILFGVVANWIGHMARPILQRTNER